jgi:hypothetical protein
VASVTRLPELTVRRSVLVELTPQGLELVDAVVEARAATELRLESVLTNEGKACLSATLRKLLLTLERNEGGERRGGGGDACVWELGRHRPCLEHLDPRRRSERRPPANSASAFGRFQCGWANARCQRRQRGLAHLENV